VGNSQTLDVTLVEPELVVEVGVDVARDASGRWRHAGTGRAPTSPPPPPGWSPANRPRHWRIKLNITSFNRTAGN
jgi:hypothetical protein